MGFTKAAKRAAEHSFKTSRLFRALRFRKTRENRRIRAASRAEGCRNCRALCRSR